jgi:hypothetical protein
MPSVDDAKVIGYFAYASETEVVCDGDACVITGSDAVLRTYMSEMGNLSKITHTVKKTRFGEIMRGLSHGGAYAFDEEAYNRFYPLARRIGCDIGPVDFSVRGEGSGMHLVRVQLNVDSPGE